MGWPTCSAKCSRKAIDSSDRRMLAAFENWWRTPPALRPVDPVASMRSRSTITTLVTPRRVRWKATLAPMQPPPTITTSALRFIRGSLRSFCDPFHRLHDTQEIAAENLLHVSLRVTFLQQRLG